MNPSARIGTASPSGLAVQVDANGSLGRMDRSDGILNARPPRGTGPG